MNWSWTSRSATSGALQENGMVGPCGLEPQTSTVSIWWPHEYRVLPIATKLLPLIELATFRTAGNTPAQAVNLGDQCQPVLNSVLKSSKTRSAAIHRSCKTIFRRSGSMRNTACLNHAFSSVAYNRLRLSYEGVGNHIFARGKRTPRFDRENVLGEKIFFVACCSF